MVDILSPRPLALKDINEDVKIHDNYFEQNTPDEEWLPVVSKYGWIILTKDLGIGRNKLQRLLVAKHGIRLFVFVSCQVTGQVMGEVITGAIKKIHRLSEKNEPPFIAKIYSNREVKLWLDHEQLLEELNAYSK